MSVLQNDVEKLLNVDGSEKVDTSPVSIGIPFERLEPIHMRTRRLIAQYLAEQVANTPETMEEMDDFDCGEEDFQYAFEEHFDHMEKLYLAEKARRDALAHASDPSAVDSDRVPSGERSEGTNAGNND